MTITRRDKEKGKIFTDKMLRLLKECHLGGTINECVLEIKKGRGSILAVDITNSIMVFCDSIPIMANDINELFGFGNIDLLIKFLSHISNKEASLQTKSNKMAIKSNTSRLNYLLTEPQLISTSISDDDKDDTIEKIEEIMSLDETESIVLSSESIKDFLSNINMLETKDVSIKTDEGKLIFVCGNKSSHQIEIVMSDEKSLKDSETKVNGEHLMRIFNAITISEDEYPATLLLSEDDSPVMISSSKTIWSLMPLSDDETEE